MTEDQKHRFITEMSDLLQRPLTEDSALSGDPIQWDSLCVVYTQGMIDDITGKIVDGIALSECQTVAQVLALAAADQIPAERAEK